MVHGLLVVVASFVAEHGLGGQAQYLWHTGLVDPWPVRSSRIRDGIRGSCIGRQILNH